MFSTRAIDEISDEIQIARTIHDYFDVISNEIITVRL